MVSADTPVLRAGSVSIGSFGRFHWNHRAIALCQVFQLSLISAWRNSHLVSFKKSFRGRKLDTELSCGDHDRVRLDCFVHNYNWAISTTNSTRCSALTPTDLLRINRQETVNPLKRDRFTLRWRQHRRTAIWYEYPSKDGSSIQNIILNKNLYKIDWFYPYWVTPDLTRGKEPNN